MSCWQGCLDPESGEVTLKCFECIFQNILNVAVRVGGIIAFIFLIIGGYQYLTAGGDPKKAQKAKNTLTYAIIGLVLLLLAWLILEFIADFTGVESILNFQIGE